MCGPIEFDNYMCWLLGNAQISGHNLIVMAFYKGSYNMFMVNILSHVWISWHAGDDEETVKFSLNRYVNNSLTILK